MSYYYADGENALIRVAVDESDQPKALFSGDYYAVDEPEAERIMSVMDADRSARPFTK
jgi:hypothetical protein